MKKIFFDSKSKTEFNQYNTKTKTIQYEVDVLRDAVIKLKNALKIAYSPSISVEDWMRSKEESQKLIDQLMNTENSSHGYSEGSEVPESNKEEEEKYPDFPKWIKSKAGTDCMAWPISEPTYLFNRLFWAFDAGRNCVWKQYKDQKVQLAAKEEELQNLTIGWEVTGKRLFEKEEEIIHWKGGYDTANETIISQTEEIKKLKTFLEEVIHDSNFPGANYTIPSHWRERAKELLTPNQ